MSTVQTQKTMWNGDMGNAWVEEQAFLDEFLNQIGDEVIKAITADMQEVANIVDLGCGCGSTSFELRHMAPRDSRVMGLDFLSR